MAKKTKKKASKKVVKKVQKKVSKKSQIEEAAELAAQEAIDSIQDYDETDPEDQEENMRLNFNEMEDVEETSEEVTLPQFDIFESAFRIAQSKGDMPRFHIKKDGQLIGVLGYPCSWEIIQKKYGGGYYNVQAKRASNGQIIKTGTEMIAEDPNEQHHEEENPSVETPAANQFSFPELFAMMNQAQEKSEQKAIAAATAQQSSMAMMMQTMMQMQQQSQQQFQMMIMELNKQTQAQSQSQQQLTTTLLTTMLSKKEGDGGFSAMNVMKMVQDASRDAETRTKTWFEMVEKKAEALAEEKAQAMNTGSEGSESLTQTVIKGFIPVLTQVMAAQQAPQAVSSAQTQAPQIEHGTMGPRLAQPPVQAPRPQQMQPQAPRNVTVAAPQPNKTATVTTKEEATKVPVDIVVESLKEKHKLTEGNTLKTQIIDIVKSDIAQAFMMQRNASKTAEACIKKLEKNGIKRQTVTDTFTLSDFYELANSYGVLDKAKPWITEFYEELVKTKTILPATGASLSPKEFI